MQIVPGTIVGGKYQVEQLLARGGMGSVWVARHVKLGSKVAVKFMDTTVAVASGAVARFEREARAAAMLDTPHVVRVHDYGVEHDIPYLVMELLRGEDLNTRLRKRRRLPLGEAGKIVAQMGRALRRAHEAGIVHRDLKPANVYLAQVEDEEVVKILDFGIAKEAWSRVEDATKTGEVFGSPHYMSPEQSRAHKTVDHRADVWAVGVIAYRIITGRLPFPGEQLGEILASVLVDPAPPIAEVAPDLPPELDAFFAKALAKKREERFASIDELVDAFLAIARSAPDRASAIPMEAPAAPPPPRAPVAPPAPPAAASGAPAPPAMNAASADTMAFREEPKTIDTSAATLPYRLSAAPESAPASARAETPIGGATGPSIATASHSLLPPELAPRRSRSVLAIVGVLVGAMLAVIALIAGALSTVPEPPAQPASSVAETPTATAPSVQVEPQRPVEPATTANATAAPAASTAPAASLAPAKKAAPAPATTGQAPATTGQAPATTGSVRPSTKKGPTPGKPDPDWGL